MRHLSIAAVAAVFTVALTQIAAAADLPVKAPVYKAPPSPAQVYSWTGFYAGLNVGGGWENTIDNSASLSNCIATAAAFCAGSPAAVPPRFDTHPRGFIGGGQIGYNWQFNALVLGVEADFQRSAIKGSQNVANPYIVPGFPANPITVAGSGSQKLDWFGTLRGRVGWLPTDELLVYATGGLAYGRVQTDVSFSGSVAGTLFAGSTTSSVSDTLTGWTVGGGLEWKFAPRWSVKGEYLYYDLGTVQLNQTITFISGASIFGLAIQSDAHYHGNIARVGANYKFW
jgi:outer membrane immunogenic protein